ncbi:MAG: GNAT family N-acetyltransferase [Polyangia bacterium]
MDPPWIVRPARPSDAALLARAERAIAGRPGFLISQPHELVEERFAEKIAALSRADNGCYLVAEADGAPIGHALLDPLPLAAVRHVTQLTVVAHPGWQGRGVGTALLAALIAWARQAPPVEKIELQVRATNTVAQALYRKLGFVDEGRRARRLKLGDGDYLDDLSMGLWVGPK